MTFAKKPKYTTKECLFRSAQSIVDLLASVAQDTAGKDKVAVKAVKHVRDLHITLCYGAGVDQDDIALWHGISRSRISQIVRIYKHDNPHSDLAIAAQHKKNMSVAALAREEKIRQKVSIHGTVYSSLNRAAKVLGISRTILRRKVRSNDALFKDYFHLTKEHTDAS